VIVAAGGPAPRGQKRNYDHPHRLRYRRRPRQARPGCEPRPAGWQPDRHQLSRNAVVGEAV
jgi:hypothetical protein